MGKNDPHALLAEVKENISRMIDRKTDAIKVSKFLIQSVCQKIFFYKQNRSWNIFVGT